MWYTAPTALRMLMQEQSSFYRQFDLSHLRNIFSVGETLNPAVINWSQQVLNKEFFDTWFQIETGAIMITNRPGLTICPGSMGKPAQGITAVILDDNGLEVADVRKGRLSLRVGWPSMFVTYLNHEAQF